MSRRVTQRGGAALAVLVCALLAGCTADVPTLPEAPTPTITDMSTQSAEPTPTVTPEPAEPNDPRDTDTWVVTTGAIGPVSVGEDFEEALHEVRRTSIGPVCTGVAYGSANDNAYDVMVIEDRSHASGDIVEVTVNWNGDTMGVGPRTAEGLGLGSTKDEVLSAYEKAEEEASQIVGRSFVSVENDVSSLVFTFRDGHDGAVAVSVLEDGEPAYEPCA